MKPTDEEIINISEEEYKALIDRVHANTLSESDLKWIASILQAFRYIQVLLEQKKVVISKLKELFFGKKTEKDKKNPSSSASSASTPPASNDKPKTQEDLALDQIDPPIEGSANSTPGHGRRPASSWINPNKIEHCHACLKAGEICPNCEKGKLYPYSKPSVFARIVGTPPLGIELHKCARLRCNLCGKVFTAPVPKDVQDFPTSTPEANSVAAVTKYQAATPFNRFATVLVGYGVPVPRTRLYEMGALVAGSARPVFRALCTLAAQGELFQNDDTKVLVQALLAENKTAEAAGVDLKRKGMFTTGIISQVGEHRIFLYFTGRNHAGENLQRILQERIDGLTSPTHVSDRSSSNPPKGVEVDDGGCMDHLRREFHCLRGVFPTSCRYVIDELKTIYRADAIAKKKRMSPSERLDLHQQISLPVMKRLKLWGSAQLDEKKVEPNGPLGHAIKYLLKHYPALTLFTRKAGVPIANSACEQSLKTPIAIRKMAYFYKTLDGAEVAGLLCSLIQTCMFIKESVYDYFVALQRNEKDVSLFPEQWFPWNFRMRLKQLKSIEA